MKKLLLFTLLLTSLLFPQLKEMEVKPTENRGGIPIFRDYPDKAGVILYTQYDNLTFYSSYGIHKVMGDPASGKYVVIIEPAKQSLEVRCPGHKSEIIKIESLQPRDVLYYEVLPKKEEGVHGVTEVGITVQVTPADAEITIDGIPVTNDKITQLKIGKHILTVSKSGYRTSSSEIEVSPANTLFKVVLDQVKLAQVYIYSEPQGAEIRINGDPKGMTDKGLFLFPGEYELGLSKDEYLPVNQKITVTGDEQKDKFKHNLIKNRGYLELTINPAAATLKINNQITEYKNRYELPPGEYSIEVTKDLYLPFSETVVVNRGETTRRKISLTQNYGTIKITTTPSDATLKLNGTVRPSSGQYDLIPGVYIVELSSDKYLPKKDTIILKTGETVNRNYSLIKNRGNFNLTVLPSNAVVKLNGERITDYRNIEVVPGNYILEVTADQYLPFSERFDIAIGTMVKRDIKLEKNTGRLILTTTPDDAEILVNRERQKTKEIEVGPGLYEITVKKETYREQSFTIDIKKGDLLRRDIKLKAITGTLQFAVSPLEAEVILEREGKKVFEWKGMKLFDSLRTGSYDLTVKLKNYKTVRKSITIRENQTAIEDIQMTAGSDSPEGMVLVEGGTFQMGSNDGESDEKPVHSVTVGSFLIAKYEVTQELWESVMGSNPSRFKGKSRPVESISWYDAAEFCNKLSEKEGLQIAFSGSGSSISCDFNSNGYRLPTESEWEYAARGGNKSRGYKYSGSNDIDEVAWYTGNSGNQTKEVGKKQSNELGIYDMSGNVWEWCWDWIGDYSTGSQTNPGGANAGSFRVNRGGSWSYSAGYCRVADRSSNSPEYGDGSLGFRLVRTRN